MELQEIVVMLIVAAVALSIFLYASDTDLLAARQEYLPPNAIAPIDARLEVNQLSPAGASPVLYEIKITGNFRYTGTIDKAKPKNVIPIVQFKGENEKMKAGVQQASTFVLSDDIMSLNLRAEISSPVPPLEYKGKSFNDKLAEFQGIVLEVANGYTTLKGNIEKIIVTVDNIEPVSGLARVSEGIFFPPCSAEITLECYNRKSIPQTFLPMSECIATNSLDKCESFIDFCGMDVRVRADNIDCSTNIATLVVGAARRIKEEKQGREKLINFEPAERAGLSFWEDSECTRLFDNYADLFQRCPDKRLGGAYEISGMPITTIT